MHSFVQGLINI